MNQSNLIFGCIFVAFVVFVTMRGELPAYLNALVGTNTAAASSNSNSNRAGATGSTPSLGQVLSDPVGAAATTALNGVRSAVGSVTSSIGSMFGF